MLGFVLFLHQRFAVALVLFAVLLGLWGGYEYIRHKKLSGGFRSSFILMAGLTALQGTLGLVLLFAGGGLHDKLHLVYGIFAIVFLPGIYFYGSRRDDAREAAFLAAASWIVTIAYLRGFMTGH